MNLTVKQFENNDKSKNSILHCQNTAIISVLIHVIIRIKDNLNSTLIIVYKNLYIVFFGTTR